MDDLQETSRPVWIATQGYHAFTLPPFVTWNTPGREFKWCPYNYTLELYSGKGLVPDKKSLDPQL